MRVGRIRGSFVLGLAVASILGGAACATPAPQPVRLVGGLLTMSGSGTNHSFGASGATVGATAQYGATGGTFDPNARSVTLTTPGQNGATDTIVLTASDSGTINQALQGGYSFAGSNADLKVTATVALGTAGGGRTARCSSDPALNFGQGSDLTGLVTVSSALDVSPALPVTSVTTTQLTRHVAVIDLNGTCFLLPDAANPTASPLTSALNVQVHITTP